MDRGRSSGEELPEVVLTAHETAVAEGKDYYIDPLSGLLSFTELVHQRRGYCCNSGCRHCPFDRNAEPSD